MKVFLTVAVTLLTLASYSNARAETFYVPSPALEFAKTVTKHSSVTYVDRYVVISKIVDVVQKSKYANAKSTDELAMAYLKDEDFRKSVNAQIPSGYAVDSDAAVRDFSDMLTCDLGDVVSMGLMMDADQCRNLSR